MTPFDRANRLLLIGVSRIVISLAMLAWRTRRRPEIFFGVPLDFAVTDAGFLESIAFTNSVNELSPTAATFVTDVRSSATDDIAFRESCERSDMVIFLQIMTNTYT